VAADNRTEKATPKRRNQARKRGQVARSQEVATAAVLIASVAALAMFGPHMFHGLKNVVGRGLAQAGDPSLATDNGLRKVGMWAMLTFAGLVAPVLIVTALAAFVANVAQVRLRLSPEALKPSFKRLDPIAGMKRLFGPNALVEAGKAVAKTTIIGGVTFLALWPKLQGLGSLVGLPPQLLAPRLGGMVVSLALRALPAIALIAALDYIWQLRRHNRSLRMSRDEVRQEARESDLSPEVRGAIRRKQMERARKRMLAAVPTADVVIANPTHFAVALRYDGTVPAPQVVAKGVDYVALAIRRVAEEHGVPVVTDPPLARALYREVELDAIIPEAFFAGVAEVLAFVYRTARKRPRTTARSA
jgi:flagellar biosynthetic protein FlhB